MKLNEYFTICHPKCVLPELLDYKQTRRASGKCAETEVRKWEEKPPISVYCIIDSWMCLVDKRGPNLCDVRARSSALGLQQASLSQIVECACESQIQTKTNGECMGQPCGLYAPGMSWKWCRCECCHSCSPMAQPATKLLQRHKYSP